MAVRTDAPPPAKPDVVESRARGVIRGIGQTLITLGVIVVLFVGYELWFTDYLNSREQHHLTAQLHKEWSQGNDPLVGASPRAAKAGGKHEADTVPGTGIAPLPGAKASDIPLGNALAIIHIPRLGLDYARTVVEGTGESQLLEGPGHYVGSAMPGQVGNFALAGHRVSKGSPFLDLDKLRPGDPIVIETKDFWYTYAVLGDSGTGSFTTATPDGIPGREIVSASAGAVVDPVPDHPGQVPTLKMITLTTCHPKFSASHRMIIHGMLASALPKGAGLPPALRS